MATGAGDPARRPTLVGPECYLNVDDVAGELGVDRDAVYSLLRVGSLHGVWVHDRAAWFVHRDQLEVYRAAL